MNRRREPNFEPASEQEWLLQERACEEVRHVRPSDASEPGLAEYRRIAHALRREPGQRLPSNFAWQVAQMAQRLPNASRIDTRLERWLLLGLMVAMAAGVLLTALAFGSQLMLGFSAAGRTGQWGVLVLACLAVTGLPDVIRHWRTTGARGDQPMPW